MLNVQKCLQRIIECNLLRAENCFDSLNALINVNQDTVPDGRHCIGVVDQSFVNQDSVTIVSSTRECGRF